MRTERRERQRNCAEDSDGHSWSAVSLDSWTRTSDHLLLLIQDYRN